VQRGRKTESATFGLCKEGIRKWKEEEEEEDKEEEKEKKQKKKKKKMCLQHIVFR
jgi:hypothetical protein